MKSVHQLNVEAFMLRAKQNVPVVPTEPTEDERRLRARLILEEAFETVEALGFDVDSSYGYISVNNLSLSRSAGGFNMVETIDGCCDIRVVTTGCLSAMGIPDEPFQRMVDHNNLQKFAPGYSWREDGKLIKPPGHQAPAIAELLDAIRNGPTMILMS